MLNAAYYVMFFVFLTMPFIISTLRQH
uniref:Uncharacterized protein n=1 Tax=Arundo donax TaxID=35708 RepID=A0A0A9BZF6_ARUDO